MKAKRCAVTGFVAGGGLTCLHLWTLRATSPVGVAPVLISALKQPDLKAVPTGFASQVGQDSGQDSGPPMAHNVGSPMRHIRDVSGQGNLAGNLQGREFRLLRRAGASA